MFAYIRLGLFQKSFKAQKTNFCEANLGRDNDWQFITVLDKMLLLSIELRSLVYDLLKCGLSGSIGIDEISSFLGELVSVLVR